MCKIGVEQSVIDYENCRSYKHKPTLTVHCLSVPLSFVMGSVGLTESHLPLLSLLLAYQSEVTEMETECFSREIPSVTLATGEVGGILSSGDRAQSCQSHYLLEPLVGKQENGERINKKVRADRRRKCIETGCGH